MAGLAAARADVVRVGLWRVLAARAQRMVGGCIGDPGDEATVGSAAGRMEPAVAYE